MQIKFIATLSLALMACSLFAVSPIAGTQVMASNNTELYAYRYIAELYEAGDSVNLVTELKQFRARYPESAYLPYIRFIEANLALEVGDYATAQKAYELLLTENLQQNVMADVMLNYSLCLLESGDYSAAMHILQRVDSEIADPEFSAQANLQRADIYYAQGQYYSAERAYREAKLAFPDNQELDFSLYSTLIKLQKEQDALALLGAQDTKQEGYSRFVLAWLEYLLAEERYQEFDDFLANNNMGSAQNSDSILEIKIRRALVKGDYKTAGQLLLTVQTQKPHFLFYTALVNLNNGREKLADSLFKTLVSESAPEIAVPAYLERLKILYQYEPLAAIVQLTNYLKDNPSDEMKAELYYTLGYFCHHKSDYPEAIKQLSLSKHYDMNRELSARIDILIAESWFAGGRMDIARESFNRYLNLYATGAARDRAWFYLGYIHFENKDYANSKPCFTQLLEKHPSSAFFYDAKYYLGEMDFYLANYNLALQHYLELQQGKPENTSVPLRIAQIYYYLGDYNNSEVYLAQLQPAYEVCILKGSIRLASKDYSAALDQFLLAESFATERLRKAEARSYRALCLYQMKRFKEASALYLQLSEMAESPDTYLFLSAKSAYAAKDYHRALELYDSFVDTHPESSHFMAALGDIANAYYNMGNFERAVTDWLNILKRFRNTREFSDSDLSSIRDALTGIELGMKRFENLDLINELLIMPYTFTSQYIQFELNLIVVKLYADSNEWSKLILAAEKMRAEFPRESTEEVALLMATGLIKLNQFSEADSLLSEIYSSTGSEDALLKWADLEYENQHYASALAKYRSAFDRKPNGDVWLRMLECSLGDGYQDFDNLWALGATYKEAYPQANIHRLNYLFASKRYPETIAMAETVINNSLSTHDHAKAFLTMGLVDYQQEEYGSAIATLKRVIMLFPEFGDIQKQAVYHIIMSQYLSGAYTEAEMLLVQYAKDLDEAEVQELNGLLESVK